MFSKNLKFLILELVHPLDQGFEFLHCDIELFYCF